MKRATLFLLVLLMCCCRTAEKPAADVEGEIKIVPQPAMVKRLGGAFVLGPQTQIVAGDEPGRLAAESLNRYLSETIGYSLNIVPVAEGPAIAFVSAAIDDKGGRNESYELAVTPEKIEAKGSDTGLFYAVQSLIQMLPVEPADSIRVPAVQIVDSPRFKYRGFHLDEARHFMGADFVEKYIRLAARYKLNYFHWHLTDDQGWRIEIEKYPKLTDVGSHRPETVVGKSYSPYKGDGIKVSGFYTKAEIGRVVEYARSMHVTIIPEIEMPGHASAALAAYPLFGCKSAGGYKVKTTWGGFPDILCPSDVTFGFIDDVMSEVSAMFPDSPYIHVGGDEVDLTHWNESPLVAQIRSREGLGSDREVLRWFIEKVGSIAALYGKKIICWDDMIEHGQFPNAVVMSWKGTDVGRMASAAGREVIMMPDEVMYFDRPQGDNDGRVSLGRVTTMQSVFNYDPTREMSPAEAKNVIGGQGLVWTEFIKTPPDVEFMAFPRMLALAETLWSRPTVPISNSGERIKDWQNFLERLSNQFPRLDREKVNYRVPEPFGLPKKRADPGERINVDLWSPIAGARIFFSIDGTDPTPASQEFKDRFPLPETVEELKAITLAPNGRISPVGVADLRTRPQFPNALPSRPAPMRPTAQRTPN